MLDFDIGNQLNRSKWNFIFNFRFSERPDWLPDNEPFMAQTLSGNWIYGYPRLNELNWTNIKAIALLRDSQVSSLLSSNFSKEDSVMNNNEQKKKTLFERMMEATGKKQPEPIIQHNIPDRKEKLVDRPLFDQNEKSNRGMMAEEIDSLISQALSLHLEAVPSSVMMRDKRKAEEVVYFVLEKMGIPVKRSPVEKLSQKLNVSIEMAQLMIDNSDEISLIAAIVRR